MIHPAVSYDDISKGFARKARKMRKAGVAVAPQADPLPQRARVTHWLPHGAGRRSLVAFIVVNVNGREVQRRNIDAPLTLGRSLDCDIWIDDSRLSRRHCKIDRESEKGWAVEDMGSRNGTYLDGHRVLRHNLKDGDVITIGHTEITFHEGQLPRTRPSDPTDALLKEDYHPPPHRRDLPKKPLPTPKVSSGDTLAMPSPQESKPLPFTRPPARPIVKPREESEG
jgi:hypothetical protein